jgi:hypothetical protein
LAKKSVLVSSNSATTSEDKILAKEILAVTFSLKHARDYNWSLTKATTSPPKMGLEQVAETCKHDRS